jgi:hypothetical protein
MRVSSLSGGAAVQRGFVEKPGSETVSKRPLARKNGNKNKRSEGIGLASVCSVCQTRRLAAKRQTCDPTHALEKTKAGRQDESNKHASEVKTEEGSMAQCNSCNQRQQRKALARLDRYKNENVEQ